MTDEAYLDGWLVRFGECIETPDTLCRMKLLRELRARLPLVANAMEFALLRIDSKHAAAKMAKEIAVIAKSVNIDADKVVFDRGSTAGTDASAEKKVTVPDEQQKPSRSFAGEH